MTKSLMKYTWNEFYDWAVLKRHCDDAGWEEDKRPCEDVMYVRFGNALFFQDGEVRIILNGISPEKMKKLVEVLYD